MRPQRVHPPLYVLNPAGMEELPLQMPSLHLSSPSSRSAGHSRAVHSTRLIDCITGYTPTVDGESPTSCPDLDDKLDVRRSYGCSFPGKHSRNEIEINWNFILGKKYQSSLVGYEFFMSSRFRVQ